MVERRTDGSAARRAAQLMAQLCSSTATARTKHDLALLVATERITLADFAREIADLADERGASASSWAQIVPASRHNWCTEKVANVVREEGCDLAVRVRCMDCGAVATFNAGALPPCTPGHSWRWTGAGWQRTAQGTEDLPP